MQTKVTVHSTNDGFKVTSNQGGGSIEVTNDGRIFYSSGFFTRQFSSWEELHDSGMARAFLD